MLESTTDFNSYTGNGATSVYSYGFKIFLNTHLTVTVRDTSNVETSLTLDVDYTVSGAGDTSGGSITLLGGNLSTGYTLVVRRNVPLLQEADIRNQGDFFAEIHEDVFDYIVMIAQQLWGFVSKSFKLPETVTGVNTTLPVPSAGKWWRWNSTATALEEVDAGDLTAITLFGRGLTLNSNILDCQLFPQENTPTAPTIAFGDGDTGLYESTDDTLNISLGGLSSWAISSTSIAATISGGPKIVNLATSSTIPAFRPDGSDANTGVGAAAADKLSLIAGGVETARFDSLGVATIGPNIANAQTPTANTSLQVAGANSSVSRIIIDGYGGTPVYETRRANGTAVSPSAILFGDQLGELSIHGYGATGYSSNGAAHIRAEAVENWTDTAEGCYWIIDVTPAGSVNSVEAVRIDSTGFVGINETAPDALLNIKGAHVAGIGLFHLEGDADHAYITCEADVGMESGIIFKESTVREWQIKNVSDILIFNKGAGSNELLALGGATSTLNCRQLDVAGAIPVARLEQLDVDDTFISFIGTTAADSTRSISSSTAEASAKFGAFKVEINGVTKWVRVYDSAV